MFKEVLCACSDKGVLWACSIEPMKNCIGVLGQINGIKESIYIMVNNPTLNRNIGMYNLHHIWDRVLLNNPGLKIKRHVQAIGHAQNSQPNSPTPLKQPNSPIPLSQPNIPMQFFTCSMEHAQRTPLSEHVHRTY